jgi:hypothetical protein
MCEPILTLLAVKSPPYLLPGRPPTPGLLSAGLIIPVVAVAFAIGGCGTDPESRSNDAGVASGEEEVSKAADSSAVDSLAADSLAADSLAADSTASEAEPLTEAQRSRLGPALRRFLTGDTTGARPAGPQDLSPAAKRDGKSVYSVTVQGVGVSRLREAGISQASEVGGIVTARLTADQIREAASIEEVRRIRASRQASPEGGDSRQ